MVRALDLSLNESTVKTHYPDKGINVNLDWVLIVVVCTVSPGLSRSWIPPSAFPGAALGERMPKVEFSRDLGGKANSHYSPRIVMIPCRTSSLIPTPTHPFSLATNPTY